MLICVILLLVDVYIDQTYDEPVPVKPASLTTNAIENKFINVLNNYNLESSWISIRYIDNENYDSLKKVYFIKLPADISIPILLNDVNSEFYNEPVKVEAVERKNYSNSSVKIYSEGFLKMQAFLNHDRKIKRSSAEILIYVMINDFSTAGEITDSLVNKNIDYNLLLIPGEESRLFLQNILQHNLDYAVLINDEMEDRFSINTDDSKQMIKNSIVSLISVYGRNTLYIVDPDSELYNSVIFSFIKDEFTKRDIELSVLTDYSSVLGREFNEVVSLFDFFCDSGKSGQRKRLIMDYETFTRLEPYILKAKKKGTRFRAK
jgi:hypothetical protein